MTAQELKDKLTEKHILTLLSIMDATLYTDNDECMIFNTVCHGGNSAKLYYYKDSKIFNCYSECGTMDVLELVRKYINCENDEFYKVINWICIKLNIENCNYGFGTQSIISDWSFINSYKKSKHKNIETKVIEYYDESILNIFQNWYLEDWINDGISINSMRKYGIKYCTFQQKVIIPHYDITNKLIGVRNRAIIEHDILEWGKYSPFKIGSKFYKHHLSLNLFGINHNIQAIKRKQKVMLVESEKGVLQTNDMFGEDNFTLALCGNTLSNYQRDMLIMLGVKEVIIALDKQFESLDSDECKKWAEHIKKKIIIPLAPYVTVTVLWDSENLLNYKDSPTDKGKETLLKLMDNKIYVGTLE